VTVRPPGGQSKGSARKWPQNHSQTRKDAKSAVRGRRGALFPPFRMLGPRTAHFYRDRDICFVLPVPSNWVSNTRGDLLWKQHPKDSVTFLGAVVTQVYYFGPSGKRLRAGGRGTLPSQSPRWARKERPMCRKHSENECPAVSRGKRSQGRFGEWEEKRRYPFSWPS